VLWWSPCWTECGVCIADGLSAEVMGKLALGDSLVDLLSVFDVNAIDLSNPCIEDMGWTESESFFCFGEVCGLVGLSEGGAARVKVLHLELKAMGGGICGFLVGYAEGGGVAVFPKLKNEIKCPFDDIGGPCGWRGLVMVVWW